MTKMPELSPQEAIDIAKCLSKADLVPPPTFADYVMEGIKAQQELLKGWVKLPSEDRLAEILLGCFLAWQLDEENKTFPEYVADRLYKILTEATK